MEEQREKKFGIRKAEEICGEVSKAISGKNDIISIFK